MMNKHRNISLNSVIKHIVLVVLCIIYIVPLYSLLLAAFRPGRDLLRYGITLKTLIPTGLNLGTVKGLYTIREGIYFTWFKNSPLTPCTADKLSALFKFICSIWSVNVINSREEK